MAVNHHPAGSSASRATMTRPDSSHLSRGSDGVGAQLRTSRMADLLLVRRRGRTRQLGSTVDGGDDLIGREMVDHVTETRKDGQLALRYFLVQAPGLTTHISDLVVPTGQDHHRQLQVAVV